MSNKDKERRKAERTQVLDSFQVFLTFPGKGHRRIVIADLNALGFGFNNEPVDYFTEGESMDCFFHINPGLKLPLQVRIAYSKDGRTGVEITEKASSAYRAFVKFVSLLDELVPFLG